MQAIITGASSGLGEQFALKLDALGYDTVIVARRAERLEALAKRMKNKCDVLTLDLSKKENCYRVFELYPDAEILINNAGFGKFGEIAESDLATDESMLALNIDAQYILMKLYLKAFKKRKHGYILNTASAAAFMAGPYFGLYYASKSFVMRISQAAWREAKEYGVCVSALCPGSVATEFNSVANTTFSSKPITSEKAVGYALKKMFAGKMLIIPTFKIKAAFVMSKLLPERLLTEFSYHTQKKRF